MPNPNHGGDVNVNAMILFNNVGYQLMDEAPFDCDVNAPLNIHFGELEGIARMPIRSASPDVPPPTGVQGLPFSIPRDLSSPTMVASVGLHEQAMQWFSDPHIISRCKFLMMRSTTLDSRLQILDRSYTPLAYPSKLKELSTYFGINKQNTINHVDSYPSNVD